MTGHAVSALMPDLFRASPVSSIQPEAALFATEQSAPVSAFTAMVSRGLQGLNEQMMSTQTDLQRLATGDVQNLHQIMIRLEETRLSFQLAMQVRNRVLEAYQDVMKMPV